MYEVHTYTHTHQVRGRYLPSVDKKRRNENRRLKCDLGTSCCFLVRLCLRIMRQLLMEALEWPRLLPFTHSISCNAMTQQARRLACSNCSSSLISSSSCSPPAVPPSRHFELLFTCGWTRQLFLLDCCRETRLSLTGAAARASSYPKLPQLR